MKQLPKFPENYWLKFSNDPVDIKTFDPKSTQIAKDYIHQLQILLKDLSIEHIYHRGSTYLGVAGKGDIEIGITPKANHWFQSIVTLANHYQAIGNLDQDYCRFNDHFQKSDIEIILLKGYSAEVDRKLHKFLLEHPQLLIEYSNIKGKYSFSKRQYYINKDRFFRKVIKMIPEE